jgi:hypothetical protein
VKRIGILPDDVLLEIFDFYLDEYIIYGVKSHIEAWQSLVHVCRRWRSLVFGSPRRLNLRLRCTPETPAKDAMDIWPALPIDIDVRGSTVPTPNTDNIVAALGQSNRVCDVGLHLGGRALEEVLAAMRVPFPEMTEMVLFSEDETPPTIPDSFLGGSAPRLQHFILNNIPIPGLPNLLLSSHNLVTLSLSNIPHSGYISPEAMVALLSVLSSLEFLRLAFQSPQSGPDRESPSLPPLKRSILPVLREFSFQGVAEYLGELVTRIDTPRLKSLNIGLVNRIDFDYPRLAQFINRTPTLRACDEAQVLFSHIAINVVLEYRTPVTDYHLIEISCSISNRQLSSVELLCDSLHTLSAVEDLYIGSEPYSELIWEDDPIENILWLELLRPFTAVKNLYLSKDFAPLIAAALQQLTVEGRITEVLRSLLTIFVEGIGPWGPFQEHIGPFMAARRLSDHPIAISVWDKREDTYPYW